MKNRWWLLSLVVCLAAAGPAFAEPRFALVIGNAEYEGQPALKAPAADAADVVKLLQGLGFRVETVSDGRTAMIQDALALWKGQLSRSTDAVGVFYFAGCAYQADGRSYLAGTEGQGLALDDLLDTVGRSGNQLNLVILEAARPLASADPSRTPGLEVPGQVPPGTILLAPTTGSQILSEPTERTDLLTYEVVQKLATANVEARELVRQIAEEVAAVTANRQTPALVSAYEGPLVLRRLAAGSAPAPAVAAATPPSGAGGSRQAGEPAAAAPSKAAAGAGNSGAGASAPAPAPAPAPAAANETAGDRWFCFDIGLGYTPWVDYPQAVADDLAALRAKATAINVMLNLDLSLGIAVGKTLLPRSRPIYYYAAASIGDFASRVDGTDWAKQVDCQVYGLGVEFTQSIWDGALFFGPATVVTDSEKAGTKTVVVGEWGPGFMAKLGVNSAANGGLGLWVGGKVYALVSGGKPYAGAGLGLTVTIR